MAFVVINIESKECADSLRQVANLIEQGYTNGILDNGETWELDTEDLEEEV